MFIITLTNFIPAHASYFVFLTDWAETFQLNNMLIHVGLYFLTEQKTE